MMKKMTYLITILFAVALMSTSCCKDDPIVPDPETLEEQYPEWSNLSWVSTDGKDANYQPVEDTYPRLEITIVGDVVNVHQLRNGSGGFYDGNFTEVTISGNVITFSDDVIDDDFDDPNVTGTFSINGNQVTFTTTGLSTTEHTYVLQ